MLSGMKKIEMKSISEGDLGSIAKKMIIGVLDDTEQLTKLHRFIYEELCFEAMQEFEKNEIEKSTEVSCRKESSIDESTEFPKKELIDYEEKNKDSAKNDNLDNEKEKNQNSKMNTNELDVTMHSQIYLEELRDRNERAFENWKKEKTKALTRACKEESMKKQQESDAQQNKIEKRHAAHEAHVRRKKLQTSKGKIVKTEKKTMGDECLKMLKQVNEKIISNEEAFRARENQRSNRSNRFQPRRDIQIVKNEKKFKFDVWLNQLDSVLDQKYTRERRYPVQSSYYQPAHYGTSDLCKILLFQSPKPVSLQ